MSSYDNIVGGKLKLKGSVPQKASFDGKKKKKKSNIRKVDNYNQDKNEEVSLNKTAMTESELKYKKQQERLESKRIEAMIELSHKERVEKYNKKLSNLPEHNDVPKVGPG